MMNWRNLGLKGIFRFVLIVKVDSLVAQANKNSMENYFGIGLVGVFVFYNNYLFRSFSFFFIKSVLRFVFLATKEGCIILSLPSLRCNIVTFLARLFSGVHIQYINNRFVCILASIFCM